MTRRAIWDQLIDHLRRTSIQALAAAGLLTVLLAVMHPDGLAPVGITALAIVVGRFRPWLGIVILWFAAQWLATSMPPPGDDGRPQPWFAVHVAENIWASALVLWLMSAYAARKVVVAAAIILAVPMFGFAVVSWSDSSTHVAIIPVILIAGWQLAARFGDRPDVDLVAAKRSDDRRFLMAAGFGIVALVAATVSVRVIMPGAYFEGTPILGGSVILGAAVLRLWVRPLAWVILALGASLIGFGYGLGYITFPVHTDPIVAAASGIAFASMVMVSALYAASPLRRMSPIVDRIGTWFPAATVASLVLTWWVFHELAASSDPALFSIYATSPLAYNLVSWALTILVTFPLVALITLLVLGFLGDVGPVILRSRNRWRQEGGDPIRIAVEEMAPGAARRVDDAVGRERSRLAAELHAGLLPLIASARSEAERTPGLDIVSRLSTLEDEVRSLISERRNVVLEELGLGQALEWLAERVEDWSAIRVELATDDPRAPGRPPIAVERAAFRVAQLAVENARLHSTTDRISIDLAADAAHLDLSVADGGSGMPDEAEARSARENRAGFVDMRLEAERVGATLEVAGRDPHGTQVSFHWQRS